MIKLNNERLSRDYKWMYKNKREMGMVKDQFKEIVRKNNEESTVRKMEIIREYPFGEVRTSLLQNESQETEFRNQQIW